MESRKKSLATVGNWGCPTWCHNCSKFKILYAVSSDRLCSTADVFFDNLSTMAQLLKLNSLE
jgi:hypothetical protein